VEHPKSNQTLTHEVTSVGLLCHSHDQTIKENVMPEILKKLLEELSDSDADQVWSWLDENPKAIAEMIMCISESHPEVC